MISVGLKKRTKCAFSHLSLGLHSLKNWSLDEFSINSHFIASDLASSREATRDLDGLASLDLFGLIWDQSCASLTQVVPTDHLLVKCSHVGVLRNSARIDRLFGIEFDFHRYRIASYMVFDHRFLEFWRACCGLAVNLSLGDHELALVDYLVDIWAREDSVAPLSKIRIFGRTQNREAICVFSRNLLKTHHEVIHVYLAISLENTLSLLLVILIDEHVEVQLVHAVEFSDSLVLHRVTNHVKVADVVGISFLNLWLDNHYFLYFKFLLSCSRLERNLRVIVSRLAWFNLLFNELGSILFVLLGIFDGLQEGNFDLGREIYWHLLVIFMVKFCEINYKPQFWFRAIYG